MVHFAVDRRTSACLVGCLLVFAVGVAVVPVDATAATAEQPTTGPTTSSQAGEILEMYPNPTTPQNHGEYVIVELTEPGEWTLTDGHATANLPSGSGTFAVTRHPEQTAAHTDITIVETESHLRLAVSGDQLELKRNGEIVDSVRYEQAPESHRWRADREPNWQPDGFEPREPKTVTEKPIEAFVLPDTSEAPLAGIEAADDRLYLAAYTLTSERVTEELIAAHERGVTVDVLVEGGPVGGIPATQADRLDELTAAGVDVQVMTGDRTRFRYQHAKYAVVDDRAVVLTENWKPSGTGGAENRGWGLVVDSPKTADELAAVFEHDAGWEDTRSWREFRESSDSYSQEQATGSYPETHPPLSTTVDELTILTAPDNAVDELIAEIDAADDRLLVVQPRISDTDFGLLRAAIRAADRGVEVRVLLGSEWYDESDNRELAAELRDKADDSDAPLEVRLAEDTDRFGKIHAKGIVADDTAVVGSLNWNNNSATNNREVAIAIEDEAVADYYAEVFAGDWDGGSDDDHDGIPVGVVVVSVGAAAGAVLLLKRRLEFADAVGGD